MNKTKYLTQLGSIVLVWALSGCKGVEPSTPATRANAYEAPNARPSELPYYKDADFTPHWLESGSQALSSFHRIGAFELTNQLGETITQDSLRGKIYVTDFFFTSCPGICAKMTKSMLGLQAEFRDDDDVLFVSHSVTPEADTPRVLNRYAKKHGIVDGKWHLVTGERSHIYQLGRHHYFIEENLGVDKDDDDFLHTENFLLIDQERRIRGIYNGLSKTDMLQLTADIRTLKKQS